MATSTTEKRLYRVREGAYAGGVCVGLAEYFELDTIVVRILAVLLTFLTCGVAVIVYAAMWVRLPLAPESRSLYDITPESAESSAFGCVDCLSGPDDGRANSVPLVARLATAAGLMVVFLLVAVGVAPLMPGTQWWQFWPICLLMLGLCLIIIPIRNRYESLWHVVGIVVMSVSASILPMSLGIMSWGTAALALQSLWPLVVVAVILFSVGLSKGNDALLLLGALCIVAFCLLGVTLCVIPGELETILLQMPSGELLKITISQ